MLAVETVDRAAPAADELPVRVEAAAVDPVDTSFREGSFLGKPVVEPS